MATKKSKTDYDRQLLKLMDEYAKDVGTDEVDFDALALWAEYRGEFKHTKQSLRKKFTRDLAKAASKDFIEDENREPVRRRLPYKNQKTQKTFWRTIDKLTPDQFRTTLAATRLRIRGEVLQADRNRRYYNKNYNPGDQILMDWDLNRDVNESRMPTSYPDEAPSDES